MQSKIKEKCDEIRDLLIEKNISYGNSVFERGVLFSIDPIKAIQARINDKLNRIKKNQSFDGDDDLKDLTGYFILLQVAMDKDAETFAEIHSTAPLWEESSTDEQ
jgi:hypothetical protein